MKNQIKTPYSSYLVQPHSVPAGNFTQAAGFKRLGIHHVTLKPGEVSSLPHAESHEEEFVYVVSGNPHAWIDGYVYELKPHCAVGFPAGTGIAHNFINNSNEDVELIVAGERTKKENLCAFPINPEQAQKSPIWWPDAPKRELGPHNGKAGPVRPNEVGPTWPSCIINCLEQKLDFGWHYPGDSETFGNYTRLTNLLNLKVLGIGFEVLKPNKRSAFPHAHLKEEEFVFILKGKADVWMNGYVEAAPIGTAALFVPGTNISHTIINNTQEDIIYLCIGEATDPDGPDKIIYPLHEFRNSQCKRVDGFWSDRPTDVPFGAHNGRPDAGLGEHLSFHHAKPEVVLDLFKRSPSYFMQIDGVPPSEKSVELALSEGPDTLGKTSLKESIVITHNDKPIGFADVIIHHPDKNMAYLGLLLLTEDKIGQGLGRKCYELLEHYLKTSWKIEKIKLGVSEGKDHSGFWLKMGYNKNGKTYRWQGQAKTTEVVEFEKPTS